MALARSPRHPWPTHVLRWTSLSAASAGRFAALGVSQASLAAVCRWIAGSAVTSFKGVKMRGNRSSTDGLPGRVGYWISDYVHAQWDWLPKVNHA